MVTLARRVSDIHYIEGFDVEIRHRNGRPVDEKSHGVLGPYGFIARMADNKTVGDWVRLRFEPFNEGLIVKVLDANGIPATLNTPLLHVRASYCEAAE